MSANAFFTPPSRVNTGNKYERPSSEAISIAPSGSLLTGSTYSTENESFSKNGTISI